VDPASLGLEDARTVVAHRHAFETWSDLTRFTAEMSRDGDARRFEDAVEAVVAGDLAALAAALRRDPALIRARSARRHRATLLHYVAANGVEGERQKTPGNAVEVATLLLEAGAEPDALADMYDAPCTTMSLLVSSDHPARAGLQGALAETLLDHGAALEGLMTALAFGFADTAQALVRRGAPVRDVAVAAGLGLLEDARRLLPAADGHARHVALALAAQHGQVEVMRLLLDAGEDPSRYNPDGFHAHSTPLHQAVWAGHADTVALLLERGARPDLRDTLYQGTPLDWAAYGGRTAMADLLRGRLDQDRDPD
jgi:ankyrin repeat protein